MRFPQFLSRLPPSTLAVFDQGLVSLNSFATMILMAWYCTKEEVGLFALAWSIVNVARVVQERAISAPYVILVHQPQRNSLLFTGSSFVHQAIFSLISSFLFLVTGLVLFSFGDVFASPQGLPSSLFVIMVAAPSVLLRDHLRIISGAHLKYTVAVALNGSTLFLQLVLLETLHQTGILSAAWAFASMGLASLIPVAVWFAATPVPSQISRNAVQQDWQTVFNFSRWLVLARLFPTTSATLLPWIVYWTIGNAGAAAFATCITLSNISSLLIIGANNYLQLKTVLALNNQQVKGMTNVMRSTAALYAAIITPFVIVIAFYGNWVMTTLFGPDYDNLQGLLTLMVLHTLLISFSTVFGNGMSAMDRPRGLFPGELAYAVVAILAACILTPRFGLLGVGSAMCLAGLTSMVTSGVCFLSSMRQHIASESTPKAISYEG